jgi:hypothetical protein
MKNLVAAAVIMLAASLAQAQERPAGPDRQG